MTTDKKQQAELDELLKNRSSLHPDHPEEKEKQAKAAEHVKKHEGKHNG